MRKIFNILIVWIAISSIVFSVPLAQVMAEAEEAPEAEEAGGAPEAQEAPEAEASPTPEVNNEEENNIQNNEEESNNDENEANYDEEENEEVGDETNNQWTPRDEERNHSGNVGDTEIETGNANSSGAVVNDVNGSQILGDSLCSVCTTDEISVLNKENGTGSDNSAAVNSDNNSSVTIDNDADVDNDLDFSANSGENTASYNVGDSEITTGDANVSGVLITSANNTGLGVSEYNIIEDYNGDVVLELPDGFWGCSLCGASGDLSASNIGNGSDSTNNASVDSTNVNEIDINNQGDIVNNFDLVANTGYNDASYNVGNSTIETGDANVAANLINLVNSTVGGGAVFVVNVFGDLIGDIIFPDLVPPAGWSSGLAASNTGNGSGSQNDANIDLNNENNVDFNNLANVDNYLTIDANTGENSVSKNTGGDSSIETGDVSINAEVLTVANLNDFGSSDEPIWLILVNNMGTWTGNLIGALTGTNYTGSNGLEFVVGDDGQILAANSGNGSDSVNNSSISQNNENNLSINNEANIDNNLNIVANTGRNSASKNTGGDSKIVTGDANVAASIINFVNSNLIGRKVMIGIVNVFGSWVGDAVPPGQEPEANNSNSSSNGSATGGSSSSSSSQNAASSGGSSQGGNGGGVGQLSSILGGFTYGGGSNNNQNGDDTQSQGTIVGGFSTNAGSGDENYGGSRSPKTISFSLNLKLLALGLIILTAGGFLLRKRLSISKV